MAADRQPTGPQGDDPFAGQVGKKESRHLRARQRGDRGVWFGLGMFGLVGWSVIIPTLISLALGLWIDATWPTRYSWTLMLLVVGVALGCYNAWHWLVRERQLIERDELDEAGDAALPANPPANKEDADGHS
jgi:ATP synthase protein I